MSELKQTDLSKRLRELAQRLVTPYETAKVMLDAAEEIERYYTGMLNWKATSEAQSTQSEATKPARTLAEIDADIATGGGLGRMDRLLKERSAALASPADAQFRAMLPPGFDERTVLTVAPDGAILLVHPNQPPHVLQPGASAFEPAQLYKNASCPDR